MMEKNLKILFMINNVFGVGGMERVTCQLANILARSGHDVTVLSLWLNASKPYFELDDNIETIKLSERPPSLFDMYIGMPLKIRAILKEKAIQRVIVSDSQLSITAGLAKIGINTKVIVWEHFHSQMGQLFGSRWFGRWFAALFINKIVVLTEQDKQSWLNKFKFARQVEAISNFLTTPLSTAEYDITSKTVLAVGRFTEVKGFDLLIQAWALLPRRLKNDWRLRIIGPKSAFKAHIELLIRELDLLDSIELVDPTPNIAQEYQKAAMLIMSSRQEPFGLVITEALANKLPVVAFDCPMGPMDILQNKYGLCVPAEDIEALADRIEYLMDNKDSREAYSKLAFERAQDYTEENIIGLWQNLLY